MYVLGGLVVAAAFIYVLAKRVNDKDKEKFEKRDN